MLPIIDLHQDLLLYVSRPDLYKDRDQTSFKKIKDNNLKVVVASAFPVPKNEDFFDPKVNQLIENDLSTYNLYVEKNPEFIIIRNKKDLHYVMKTNGVHGLILHIEGLNVFNTKEGWSLLNHWYDMGLRSIGPMWNTNNLFGGGTKDTNKGLTKLGEKLLVWCEKNGLLFDFAHMNSKTFYDASKIVTRPILVSHGNSSAICPSPRNYTDKQLEIIGRSNGVIGVFFSKKFITNTNDLSIHGIIKHINQIEKIAGNNAVALGTDFGGIVSGFIENLHSTDNLQSLLEKKQKNKNGLAFKNALRIINSHLN